MMKFGHLVKKKQISLTNQKLRDGDLDVLVKVLQKSKVLAELVLYGNQITLADGKLTNALANNRTLQRLNLTYNNMGPEGAKKLAAALKINKTLQELDLSNNQIGDECIKSIADALMNNSSLQVLGLRNNNIGDEGAKSLAASLLVNQSLCELWLNGNNISDKGAKKLADALRFNFAIIELELEGNDDVSKKLAKTIKAILKDPNRKAKHAQKVEVKKLKDNIASRDHKISSLQKEIADKDAAAMLKDEQLAAKDERIVSKDAELALNIATITSKDQEIATLKAALESPFRQLISSQNEKIALLEANLKNSTPIEIVDLSTGDEESSNKRQRTDDVPMSSLAIQHEQNQKIIQVKQEKDDVETALKTAEDKKKAVEANLEEVQEDFEIATETVGQQLLTTDILQGRIDELVALFQSGQADGAAIAEIRDRSLASGH